MPNARPFDFFFLFLKNKTVPALWTAISENNIFPLSDPDMKIVSNFELGRDKAELKEIISSGTDLKGCQKLRSVTF